MKHKKLALSAGALITAAGLALSSLFSSPAELLQNETPSAIIISAEQTDVAETPAETKKGRGSVRSFILRLPLVLRLLLCVPLWCVGSGLLWLISSLFSGLGSVLLTFVATLALLCLCFTLACKTLFPNMPISKILSRKNLLWLVVCAVLINAAALVLPLIIPDAQKYMNLARALLLLLCLSLSTVLILRRTKRLPLA